jgi:hypothetical protein
MAVSPDGSKVFVTGSSNGSTGFDYATVAYEATTGDQLWVTRYDGPDHSGDSALKIKVSPDGSRVFVTGYSYATSTQTDYATIAYDAISGTELWTSRHNGPGNGDDYAFAMDISPDGSKVFVTGESAGTTGGFDYATVAYDAATGTAVWVRRLDGPSHGTDHATALVVSPNGGSVFVTGWTSSGSGTSDDFATVRYSSGTGRPLWVTRYDGPGHNRDDAYAIAVSPDGSTVYVTGSSVGRSSGADCTTIAFSAASATPKWAARFNGPDNSIDFCDSMAVAPDGSRVIVAGQTNVGGGTAFLTVGYGAGAGTEIWVEGYDQSTETTDSATSVVVTPDSYTALATGYSNYDYATAADRVTVRGQFWTSAYASPNSGFDLAESIAVNPDGSLVFVTGESASDYATVAYEVN